MAALVISSVSYDAGNSWLTMAFPVIVSVGGILSSMIASLLTQLFYRKIRDSVDVGSALKFCMVISSILTIPVHIIAALICIPEDGILIDGHTRVTPWETVFCLLAGMVCGAIIGVYTEYVTSARYQPTKSLANSSSTGAATNILGTYILVQSNFICSWSLSRLRQCRCSYSLHSHCFGHCLPLRCQLRYCSRCYWYE